VLRLRGGQTDLLLLALLLPLPGDAMGAGTAFRVVPDSCCTSRLAAARVAPAMLPGVPLAAARAGGRVQERGELEGRWVGGGSL
jgi:hypothetical protein